MMFFPELPAYALAVLLLILLAASLHIANQYERAVIFRLGKYARTSGPGLYMLVPLIEWQTTIDVRTITTAVEQQEAITRDNVPIKINAVIWRRIIDPARAVVEVANVGKVERVQMKNVEIPESMQRAIAQEAEAERKKRARQIKAQAELDAATLLRQAAETIMQSPAGLELRRIQMITEGGADQNTMTIIMVPSEFVDMARNIASRGKS